jgi:hypothetical protein
VTPTGSGEDTIVGNWKAGQGGKPARFSQLGADAEVLVADANNAEIHITAIKIRSQVPQSVDGQP